MDSSLNVQRPAPGRSDFSFGTLVEPTGIERFFESHWERAPLLLARDDPSYYGSVFSLEDVDRYMLSSPDRRVTIVPPPDRKQASRSHRLGDVSMDELYGAFHSGETIRLESVQLSWSPVAALIASIAGALNAKLNVNLYMTPPGSQGLPSHFDTHDVFILQVAGSKEWRVWEADVRLPVETPSYLRHLKVTGKTAVDEDDARLLHAAIVRTGDLLYMPRGFPHRANTTDEPSIHLAVAVQSVHWVHLLVQAVELATIDHSELREALPPGFLDHNNALHAQMEARFGDLLERCCQTASFQEALAAQAQRQIAGCRFPPDGHFAELVRLDELDVADALERRPGLHCRVESRGDMAVVEFAGNEIAAPVALLSTLEFIRDHQSFRVEDLPGPLSDKSLLVLVRRLIREGLLRRARRGD